ncbi:MAG: LuxR C-terminal-related transcriptional regulator [Actinomycetota bacterium]|nr:LuxR C-terminal-related transcriptional regulator [Actinomycetota bacterium]
MIYMIILPPLGAGAAIVGRMMVTEALHEGRESFGKQVWGDAFARLSDADRDDPLEAEDLERLAIAAYMVGKDDASADACTRAHHSYLQGRNFPAAARCAFWHACGLFFKGDMAPAMGWVARGRRVLESSQEDCPEQGWLLFLTALPIMFQGDPHTAHSIFEQAGPIAERFNDPDVMTLSRLGCGQSLIMQQRASEGTALLDELMIAVVSGEVSPLVAGVAYCAVIDLCHSVFDLRRAREWTAALSRWCDSQPDLVPYRGNCLVHRCEIFQLQGAWADALKAAERACEWLSGPTAWDSLGSAYYQLGEIERLRGEFEQAEQAYRRASHAGRQPEPGMSLLRLAQHQVGAATAAIRRALNETQEPMGRSRLLPAYIEIVLAADEVEAARNAADELAEISRQVDAPFLHAIAASSTGAVLLAESDAQAALTKLRAAFAAYRELDAPHHAARARVLIGLACRALGDSSSAEMEVDAARAAFEELGAVPDLERVAQLMAGPSGQAPGGLTRREVQVLELVASGKTNRAIATELFLSERTVARHVSNIFTKLGLSSRSAATAYAYEHRLV